MNSEGHFLITLDGQDLHPEAVEYNDFHNLIEDFRKAASATLGQDTEFRFALTAVRDGSADYAFSCSEESEEAVLRLREAIASGQYNLLPFEAHLQLHNLSRRVAKKNWLFRLSNNDASPAEISTGRPVPMPEASIVESGTTVYATLVRVGGVQPVALIELLDTGERFSSGVSKPLAQKLGQELYKELALSVTAKWRVEDMQMLSLTIDDLLPYDGSGSTREAIESLRDATKGAMDGREAEEYLEFLKSEDD